MSANPLGPGVGIQLDIHLIIVKDAGVVECSGLGAVSIDASSRIIGSTYLDNALAGEGGAFTPHGGTAVAATTS